MTNEQEPDDITENPQKEIEKAFVNSTGHQLQINGTTIALEPYSAGRMVAAQAMGLRWDVLNETDRAVFNETKVYPSAVQDVIIVMWLCHLKTRAEVSAARRAPIKAYDSAEDWASELGIHDPKRTEFWEAYSVFFEIQKEVTAATVEAQKKTNTAAN